MPAPRATSLARIAANRRNCQLSTGPKTAEGKARARANAVRHGLTGAGIALPTEDVAAIEVRSLAMQEEFAPHTVAGAELVHELAKLLVRKHRAERAEDALVRGRVRRAGAEFDRAREQRADQLIDAIEANPRVYRKLLRETPEGIDRLIASLRDLRSDMTGVVPTWTPIHHRRLDALFGFRPDDLPRNRPTRFSRALVGEIDSIGPRDEAPDDDLERTTWIIERIFDVIDAEITALTEHRATLDRAAIAADRSDAIAQAEFDPSRDAELARRYAATAGREFSRTLRDYHIAEALAAPAEPEPLVEDPAPCQRTTEPNSQPDNDIESSLASFGGSRTEPAATPVAAPQSTIEPAPTTEPTPVFTPIRG